VLEVVLGKSLDKVLQERVFDPLGMLDTMWKVPETQLHRLAGLYAKQENSRSEMPLRKLDGPSADSAWANGGTLGVLAGGGFMSYAAGGLVSTAADTARFVRMLLCKGVAASGRRLLAAKTLREMEKNRLKASLGAGKCCYLGNIGSFRDGCEFGMGGAAHTYWSVDRMHDVAVVWFAQHLDMGWHFNDPFSDLWQCLHDAGAWRQVPRRLIRSKKAPVAARSSVKAVRKRPASAGILKAARRRS